MNLRKIIRCEDVHGVGMYRAASGNLTDEMCDDNHPDPHGDEKLRKYFDETGQEISSFYFGWKSKAQAKRWLYKTRWLRQLHAEGLVVSEYMCEREDTCMGTHQAIFRSHESKESFNILEYFNLSA